jgi:hypothetical protein
MKVPSSGSSSPPKLLAQTKAKNDTVDWFTNRKEYGERLDVFLARARVSISIVAVTCKLSSVEGSLQSTLKEKLLDPYFRVQLSLLDPTCLAIETLALSLGTSSSLLASAIGFELNVWNNFVESLEPNARTRFDLRVHNFLPFGSAYMLDIGTPNALIHVETKLPGAPKEESFGFRVAAPGAFFDNNLRSWLTILERSYVFQLPGSILLNNRERPGIHA